MARALRIAVADDEVDIREYLERVLPVMGHKVVAVAEHGRQLLELCRECQPDLVISDIRMPELDGDEVRRQLGEHIPFIAISAFPPPASLGSEGPGSRYRHLHKPVSSRELQSAIASLFPENNLAFAEVPLDRSENEDGTGPSTPPGARGKSHGSTPTNCPLDLLIVDDDPLFVEDVVAWFRRHGHAVVGCRDGATALEQARARVFDVAVLDLALPGLSGLDLLPRLKEGQPDCEIVMLTGNGTIELAVESMRQGAFDFLTKPIRLAELEKVLTRARAARQIRRENSQLRRVLDQHTPGRTIIGLSPAMQEVFRLIPRVGATDKAVLIEGESGTGKELVARAIHAASPLGDMPLVIINCAALPETLLESELFGHEKGAFTGAVAAKPGLFEVADGGTLFIDEIGELAGSLQAKLLRVLEDGSLRRIGSIKERRVRVRLIAATNRDMQTEVREGRFREDLYYRINVLAIQLPPLRARAGDLDLLVHHLAGPDWEIELGLVEALECYSWPGNVRQLANAIERAKILADDEVIRLANFPPEIRHVDSSSKPSPVQHSDDLDSRTRRHVIAAYEQCGRNKARTARALGIGRRSLYRLLEKYGIHEPAE